MEYSQAAPGPGLQDSSEGQADPGPSANMDTSDGSLGSDMDLGSSAEEDSEDEAGKGKMPQILADLVEEDLLKENINCAAYDECQTTASEPAGVLHLVHGWIQQGQPKKVSGSPYLHCGAYSCLFLGTLCLRRYP